MNLLQTISKHKAIGSREAASIVRDAVPGSFVKQKDIDNARQRLRRTELNGRTAVQQFISILLDMGYKRRIQWAEEDPTRPVALVWTYPWCEGMWGRFPEVIGFDNTYKTNRFKMPLFQVTGTTDTGSLYNCAFGLASTERREGYDFLLKSLESIRAEIHVERPKVAITDFEDALRSSITGIWPDTQLQLCIFHINQNVSLNAKRKWQGPGGPAEDELDVNRDKEAAENEAIQNLNDRARANEMLSRGQQPAEIPHTPTGFCQLWAYIVYANTEEDFDAGWARLQQEFSDQQPALDYISNTYLPVRYQWANCFISQYENFGVRTNSPTETAHKDLKSYIVTGNSDLYAVSKAIEEMIQNKARTYTEKVAEMETRTRYEYLHCEWLGAVSKEVGTKALALMNRQHQKALPSLPTDARPHPPDLPPCSGTFSNQYRLPCSHKLLDMMKRKEPLTKEHIHPRWWLRQPLVSDVLYVRGLY